MKTRMSDLPKTYMNMMAGYNDERDRLKNKISLVEGELTYLNEHLNNLDYPSWIDELLIPLADIMLKRMPGRSFEIMGPFGLYSTTSIHFTKKGDEVKKFRERDVKSITFRPSNLKNGIIEVVDYSKKSTRYNMGTIGEINGGNYDTIPLPKDLDGLMNIVNRK